MSRKESAPPNGQSLADLNWRSITLPMSWLSVPPSRSGMKKAPSAGMKTMITPDSTPCQVSGKITEKKVRHWPAPRSRLASI